jgi:hypothetical protein
MSERGNLILSTDLGEYFRTEVNEARGKLGLELSEVIEFYVVNLLCDFSRRDEATITPGEEPLALMLKRALDAPVAQRIPMLKQLGDSALYVAGFFAEFVEKSMVDVDYYVSMGGRAYSDLSNIVGGRRRGDTFAELYEDLASKFKELVHLLTAISDKARVAQSGDLLKLYERWARTGSSRIKKLLVARGLVPPTEFIQ